MNKRFTIERLMITGQSVKPAILSFSSGTNLIIGSSDTGKSYIFQCINYLLGGYACPKDIPESKEYLNAYLQLKTDDNIAYTISRQLRNNAKAYLSKTIIEKHDVSKTEIGVKNNTCNRNNISEFLLSLMGIQEDVMIKKNANNKTVKLSYRDIARLTLVDEERIITEGSPVYTSKDNYLSFTAEQSAFKYLLTARDDKDLKEIEEKKVRESRLNAKIELLTQFIQSKHDAIAELQKALPTTSTESQRRIEELIVQIQHSSSKIEDLTVNREVIYKALQSAKSDRLREKELIDRFYLLREHYNSDLNRLRFILDGEFLFSQLSQKDCPLCGTLMTEKHLSCLSTNLDINSIQIEGKKIELKIKDLDSTIANSNIEINTFEEIIRNGEKKLKNIDGLIESELKPLHQKIQKELDSLLNLRNLEQEISMRKDDITNYSNEKSRLEIELLNKPKNDSEFFSIENNALNSFCKTIEQILKEWKYPNLTTVGFDINHKVYDIIISNRKRNSHGKGIRSLSYAGFTIGLLDYCINKGNPHPGIVVLDSPLTTYHNNKEQQIIENEDEVSEDMQNAFYKYLSTIPVNRQIIILDNKIPNTEIIEKVNYIQFSNSTRKGFFPAID